MKDVLDFVLENKGELFSGWADTQIWYHLWQYSEMGGLRYFIDSSNKITGMFCAYAKPDTREIYVGSILCTTKESLRAFLCIYAREYASYKIIAKRNGKNVTYPDSIKLLRRLWNFKST